MLTNAGIHPYVLRRRKIVLSRAKPKEGGLTTTLVAALLLIAGFAYGLRSIDRRFAAPSRTEPSSEVRHLEIFAPELTA